MARDMDLIRQILLEMERLSEDGPPGDMTEPLKEALQSTGYSDAKILHHLLLLDEAGYIEAIVARDFGTPVEVFPIKINWPGYDFLEAIRDEGIYKRATATAKDKAGGLVFSVVKDLAILYMRQAVGLGE